MSETLEDTLVKYGISLYAPTRREAAWVAERYQHHIGCRASTPSLAVDALVRELRSRGIL